MASNNFNFPNPDPKVDSLFIGKSKNATRLHKSVRDILTNHINQSTKPYQCGKDAYQALDSVFSKMIVKVMEIASGIAVSKSIDPGCMLEISNQDILDALSLVNISQDHMITSDGETNTVGCLDEEDEDEETYFNSLLTEGFPNSLGDQY
eukprot:TRINITY_DN774040_c0_g1_i1.p1 TRINITY_DN774040_c0_g1~~TRINITY_DN774040_c0_g1_i1.p1  ORF type:complete len:150 (+),score=23.39 TRINITY_DN774040_c0_g1_i1:170-619(+)